MATVVIFTSSGTFSVTSSITASVQVWGAGGNGDGNSGGSGGAYASSSVGLVANNVYSCSIAQPFSLSYGSDVYALSSSFSSGSTGAIFVCAAGGSNTGLNTFQSGSQFSGSIYFIGGLSPIAATSTEDYNGPGGGASGGPLGAGAAGSSANSVGRTGAGVVSGASGGTGYQTGSNNNLYSGQGGTGGYYNAGASFNTIIPGQTGTWPGGGGGGPIAAYNGPNPSFINSAPVVLGAAGGIVITF
jgi:hypothetical protein